MVCFEILHSPGPSAARPSAARARIVRPRPRAAVLPSSPRPMHSNQQVWGPWDPTRRIPQATTDPWDQAPPPYPGPPAATMTPQYPTSAAADPATRRSSPADPPESIDHRLRRHDPLREPAQTYPDPATRGSSPADPPNSIDQRFKRHDPWRKPAQHQNANSTQTEPNVDPPRPIPPIIVTVVVPDIGRFNRTVDRDVPLVLLL